MTLAEAVREEFMGLLKVHQRHRGTDTRNSQQEPPSRQEYLRRLPEERVLVNARVVKVPLALENYEDNPLLQCESSDS